MERGPVTVLSLFWQFQGFYVGHWGLGFMVLMQFYGFGSVKLRMRLREQGLRILSGEPSAPYLRNTPYHSDCKI